MLSRANTAELLASPVLVPCDHSNLLLSDKTLRLVPNADVSDATYLYHALLTAPLRRYFASHATGTSGSMRNVSQETIRAAPIPLPSLSEQKRIAGILDQADGLRRKRQQALALTDQFLRSTFLDLFGDPVTNPKRWPIRKFADVCESRLGKMLDAKQQTGKHCRPYLRNLNVQWGRLDLTTMFEMDFDDEDRLEFSLQPGDVMICEGGAGVGQTAIWRGELPECYFGSPPFVLIGT